MSDYTTPVSGTQVRAIAELIAEMPDKSILDSVKVSFYGVPWLGFDEGVLHFDCSVILDAETAKWLGTLSREAVTE